MFETRHHLRGEEILHQETSRADFDKACTVI